MPATGAPAPVTGAHLRQVRVDAGRTRAPVAAVPPDSPLHRDDLPAPAEPGVAARLDETDTRPLLRRFDGQGRLPVVLRHRLEDHRAEFRA